MSQKILLSILSALLMSCGWVFESGWLASFAVIGSLFGFVPLLKLQKKLNGEKFIRYVLLTFLIFNLITISWVSKAAIIGVIAATGVYIVLFGAVMYLYNYIWKRAPKSLSYTILVATWIAAERIYFNGEISFPWLNIGTSFAQNPYIIQWIEYTGILGVSLWALIVNIVTFEMLEARKELKRKFKIALGSIIAVPIIISLAIYFSYEEQKESINISVLQPNIDPYNEKFGGLTSLEQENILIELIKEAPKNSDYFVAPETALDRGYYIDNLKLNSSIKRIKETISEKSPTATYVGGLTTIRTYPKNIYSKPPTVTARDNDYYYYDVYNSSIQIDTSNNLSLYHKVKLVIGVEMLPYHEHLAFINKLSVSLGGTSGMLGSSDKAEVFKNQSIEKLGIGSAICYESLYGEYFSNFVKEGAKTMFVITNDGWWGDTFGYHQHLMFSQLRAIETRRSISRSANTGISAFINEKGVITKSLGWDKRGVINSDVTINNKLTFFVVFGDMIGRISIYVMALCLLYYIAYRRRKKDHIV